MATLDIIGAIVLTFSGLAFFAIYGLFYIRQLGPDERIRNHDR